MPRLLQDWVTEQAYKRSDARAVVSDSIPTTYGELDVLSTQLARMLKEVGCRKGDRVALLMPKSPIAIIGLLGIYKADCIYVPLDPLSPVSRLKKILNSCENTWLLAANSVTPLLKDLLQEERWRQHLRVGWLDRMPPDSADIHLEFTIDDVRRSSTALPGYQNASEDAAHILFTSGSTGTPKGVVITHASMIHFIEWATRNFALDSSDRNSAHPPLHFDVSFLDIFGTAAAGGELHLVPREFNAVPNKLADFIRTHELTQWFSVPSILKYMAKFDVVRYNDFPKLKRLLWAGEVLPTPTLIYLMTRLPHVRFSNLYGPTETTTASSYHTVTQCPTDPRAPIPIGTACDGEELLVLDDSLQPLPVGETGELYIGGVGLAREYWRDRERTEAAFIRHPQRPGERLYRTGDLAKLGNDGLVYFAGRRDSQIKSRGYRIEIGEIEAALHAIAGIQECAVVALNTTEFEGAVICCAYVPKDGIDLRPATLRRDLSGLVPSYMVPARWLCFDQFPQNASGKVDRLRIKEIFEELGRPDLTAAASVPDSFSEVSGARLHCTTVWGWQCSNGVIKSINEDQSGPDGPPSLEPDQSEAVWNQSNSSAESLRPAAQTTPTEAALAAIWADLLALDVVHREDNFFALGGDSIVSLQIVGRARAAGLPLTMTDLLDYQTISKLAAVAEKRRAEGVHPEIYREPEYEPDEELSADDLTYPLVPLQRGMLFHSVRAEEGGEYFEQLRLRVRGVVEPETFRWAWDVVVRRHEALRTGFVWEGVPEPVQVVRRQVAVPWVEEDWRALAPTVQQARLRTWLAADRAAGFDLAQAPLLRLRLIRVEHAEYEFVWSHHHLLLDGWSAATVLTEVLQLYGGRRRGSAVQLGRPRRYRTYVEWLARQEMGAAEGYWRQQLAGVTATRWRSWHRECEVKTGALTQVARRVPHATTAAVAAFAREQAVTPSAVVAAAWGLVLCRWGSGRDVVFGMTVAGRPAELAGIEQMVGLFINTVPVRVQVDEGAAIGRWVQEVHRAQLARQPYEWAPLPEVQRWSGVEGPLFDTLLVYENYPVDDALRTQTEVEVTEAELIERTSYAVAATAVPGPELQLQLMGDAGRLSGAEATQLVEDWTTVLTQLVEKGATARVAQVALGADAAATGAPQYDAAAAPSVPALFAAQAARTPDAVAIVDGSCAITYGVLNARAAQLARHLERYGVAADVPVGVFLPAGIDALVAFLGCWKAGGTYVPIDIDSPLDRMAAILGGLDVRVVISDPTLSDRIPGAYGIVEIASPEIALESGADAPSAVTPTQVAYILYTSGSSGQPKGVMVTHDGLGNYVEWARGAYQVTEATWSPLHTSLCFDLSVTSWLLPLVAGGTVEIVSRNAGLASIAERLPHRAGAVVKLTPGQLRVLTDLLPPGARAHVTATLVVGGEPLVSDDVAPWIGRSGLRINNEYGPTETVVGCAVEEVTGESVCDGNVAIGRAIARTTLTVVDDALRPVPAGVPGELLIGGAGVGRGYVGRPDLTAERFVPDPADALGRRAYRTGDLVRRRLDGRLEYLGRLDTQVKIRGYRVELGEVEEALRAHPSVAAAAVLVDGDDRRRELVAYVAPRSGAAVTGAALTMWLTAKLPDYMVPPRIIVVVEIPLTPNGKVNRQALLRLDTSAADTDVTTYVAPRTPTETLLSSLWCNVLRLDAVGIHDNFFALGGDSILCLQVVGRARAEGLTLTLNDLLEHPTIADLADLCARASQLTLTDRSQFSGTLTPVQAWFFDLALADPNHFNQAIRLELTPDVDLRLFCRAVAELISKYPAFRFRFKRDPGRGQSHAASEAPPPDLQLVELSSLPHGEALNAIEIYADRYHRTLDIESGPLAQLALFMLGSHAPQLLIVVHHLIVDGVSWRILLEDLEHTYLALSAGRSAVPLQTSATVHEWVTGLTAWSTQTDFAAAVDYWVQLGRHVVGAFPVDERLGAATGTARIVDSLDVARTTALVHFARAGRTQNVLLAALATTLAEWTGAASVMFDLEGHGREAAPVNVDVSRTVAWFTAIFPVVLTVDPAAGWDVVLSSVEEQIRTVPFGGIPFGVGRYLSADRALVAALDSIPARHVCFNYLGQLDLVIARSQLFRATAGGTGQAKSENEKRPYPIELNCYVRDGRLWTEWSYDDGLHRSDTMHTVSGRFMTALREMISVAERLSLFAGEFPLAKLRRGDLAVLAQKLTTTDRP